VRKYIISLLLVAVLVTPLFATTTNKIHDFATGIMHSADTISFTPTVEITSTNVQDAVGGLGSTLTSYATKAYVNGTDENIINTLLPLKANITYVNGTDETIINTYLPLKASITYVNGTDENIINTLLPAKANASYVTGSTETALLTHTGNSTNPHGMTISNLPTLSGTNTFTGANNFTGPVSLTDGTNTSTIIPPFRTDKSKCNLLVDFDNSLVDKTRGITPTGYSTANMWSNGWVNDTIAVGTATSLGGTFKTFDGDRGKFGGGIAVEESRSNLYLQSSDLTVTWTTENCSVSLDSTLPDGRKKYKITATGDGNFYITQVLTFSATSYTFSATIINTTGHSFFMNDGNTNAILDSTNYSKLTRIYGTISASAGTRNSLVGLAGAHSGDYIYVTSPQVEAGAFPTSYIATTTAAVTRPVEKIEYYFANPFVQNQSFSWTCWVKENYQSFENQCPIVSTSGYTSVFDIYRKTVNTQTFVFRANDTTGSDITLPAFDTNWHLWTMTSDGTNVYFYVDAVLIASKAMTTTSNTYAKVLFQNNGSSFNNFVLFNYTLTLAEIKQIYYSNKPIMCEGSVKKEDITRTFAGDPNNDFAPMYLNEMVWDSTNSKWYKSKGVLSNAAFDTGSWILLN